MTDVQTRTDAETEIQQEKPTRPGTIPTRRAVLAGAGALGATCFLVACGTDTASSTNTSGTDFTDNPAPAGSTGAASTTDAKSGDSSATALAAVADIPSGGGIIKGDLVITQPQDGTFKAFSKVCTHQGCDVNKVDGGLIICPCHGAKYSIEDGSPTSGPATKALAETKVKVDGDNIVEA